MKRRKFSTKALIFLNMISFAGLVVLILWVLLGFNLGTTYRTIRKVQLYLLEKDIDSVLEKDGEITGDEAAAYALRFDASIRLSDYGQGELFDTGGKGLLTSEEYYREYWDRTGETGTFIEVDAAGWHEEAEDHGHGSMEADPEASGTNPAEPGDDGGREELEPDGDSDSIIAVRRGVYEGTECMIVVRVQMEAVTGTRLAVMVMMAVLTVLTLIMSLVMARVLSTHLTRPIVRMSEQARGLGRAGEPVRFDEAETIEFAELAHTLNEVSEELSRTEELRHELIANVSHDLRTPLTMITAYAEMMRDLPGENNPENLQVIIEESGYLSTLVTDLLNLSRLEAGVVVPNLTIFDLAGTVDRMVERSRHYAEQRGITVEWNRPAEYPVCADEEKICQVLFNLIGNAMKHSGENRRVVVSMEEQESFVRVSVQDFGHGIPEEELDHIWERYYKGRNEDGPASAGSGIGLSIVQQILKLHKAGYGVKSRVGEGSTFWFELPCVEEERG